MDAITPTGPAPEDNLDQGQAADQENVDSILESRHVDHQDEVPTAPAGTITNPEVQYLPTDADRAETDPHNERPQDT